MKKLLILIVIVISSCNSDPTKNEVWTAEYEQTQFRQIDESMRVRFPDDNRRKQLVSYVVTHLKEALPNGVESIPLDSLMRLSSRIAIDYAYTQQGHRETKLVPTAVNWTPEMDKMLREVLLKGVKKENLTNGNKICNCIINKLRIIYPDKVIVPFPHDVVQKVAKECHEEMPGISLD